MIIKKIKPKNTWNPWKPVEKKKILPNKESEKLKNIFLYSLIWIIKNIYAKIIVTKNLIKSNLFLFKFICKIVIENPLLNKIKVLIRGILKGLIKKIYFGIHWS